MNAIQLNENFRLTADSAQFIVKQRKLVDPTKAPGYKPEENASTPELKERWDDAAYYPLTSAGLTAALDRVRMKSAALSNATTLTELMAALSLCCGYRFQRVNERSLTSS
ncbi:hypothetical protein PUW25_08475 [Paenibacillus urinalis]|uniref:DNA helicase n=1 Tax=Paenibacillus urinalis TaxID=521520 RepID=A0ABY7XE27_9BACL|nr:hypothetical protein [Paenibacillus urinalis]WDI03969.1 hypothetical protein PUW25_08475 [Paenibacillus urinalis]